MENTVEKCYYCQYEFGIYSELRELNLIRTKDHIIPKSKGGNNSELNIIIACSQCNTLKGTRLPTEFAKFLLKRINIIVKEGGTGTINYPLKRLHLVLQNTNTLIETIEPYKEKLLKGYIQPKVKKIVKVKEFGDPSFQGKEVEINKLEKKSPYSWTKRPWPKEKLIFVVKWKDEPEPNFHY